MSDLFEEDHSSENVSFDDLVGDGKKYKTPEDAAKALIEKDRFIEQLKSEGKTFRDELRARQSLEEIAERLGKAPTNGEPPRQPGGEPSSKQDEPAPTDLKAEVKRLLDEERNTSNRQANLEKAKAEARAMFGSDYSATLRQIAVELNVSDKFLTDIAASSPDAFVKLVTSVRTPENPRPSAPPASTFDASRSLGTSTRKNNAFYQDMRKRDFNQYMSKKVQMEIYKAAMEQGPKFYE